jgi:ABC-type sugar transport system ATPase subunit
MSTPSTPSTSDGPAALKTGSGPAGPAIAVRGVSKTYGATRALIDIDLEIAPGTVHALIGENGAGKSTTLGTIAGRVAPSEGKVEIFGEELSGGDLRGARDLGVASIYQELTIVPTLNAEANVFLGQQRSQGGFLAKRRMRSEYLALCKEIGIAPVPARAMAGSLSVADQQMLEIMRALVAKRRIILFDEPTAPLAIPQRETLYGLIENLRSQGITVVFVSHNLGEVQRLADRITVFRDGQIVADGLRGEFSEDDLVAKMLGEAKNTAARRGHAPPVETVVDQSAPPLLRARGVTVPGSIEGIDIDIRAGEILGVAGLVGSGRSTLLRALAGAEPRARGELEVEGKEVSWPRTVRRGRRNGVGLIPEDRKAQGLVMTLSAADNIAIADMSSVTTGGMMSNRKRDSLAAAATETLGFPKHRMREEARNFSGGNQQKLLMARWRHCMPKVLLADEPTRGIDVGAKAELLEALRQMAAEGIGVVIVSSELEEVVAVSDRVIVLAEGQMAAEFRSEQSEPISMMAMLQAAFKTREEK